MFPKSYGKFLSTREDILSCFQPIIAQVLSLLFDKKVIQHDKSMGLQRKKKLNPAGN